jgi:hypothetical protein
MRQRLHAKHRLQMRPRAKLRHLVADEQLARDGGGTDNIDGLGDVLAAMLQQARGLGVQSWLDLLEAEQIVQAVLPYSAGIGQRTQPGVGADQVEQVQRAIGVDQVT